MSSKIGLCFKGCFFSCFVLFIASLMLSTASPLFAQGDEEFTLEEITVTAEKREAELQKIPMDIAVIRPDDMDRLNIHQVEDLDKMLPDMNITNFASGMLVISVRDVETGFWNPTTETTVAVHVDGVQLTRSMGLEGKMYDLERVETLKGPQGTLYGRGSTAGSMNMITKRPDIGEFGGNLSVEYGNYDRQRIEGALNIPVAERLAFRISGRSLTRDGYDDANLGNQDTWGVRGSMRWEPTDTQSLVFTIDRDVTDNRGGYSTGTHLDTYGNLEIVANPRLSITDPDDPAYVPENLRKYFQGGPVHAPYEIKAIMGAVSDDQFVNNKSYGMNAQYDKEFDFAWLTVQSSYRSLEEHKSWVWNNGLALQPLGSTETEMYFPFATFDPVTGVVTPNPGFVPGISFVSGPVNTLDPVPGHALFRSWSYTGTTPVTQLVVDRSAIPYNAVRATVDDTKGRTFSAEARLTSKKAVSAGDKYEWLLGSMYMNDHVLEKARLFENVDNEVTLKEYAVFGQASYVPFANINFTGGYRYTWDTKDFYGTNGSVDAPADPSDFWLRDLFGDLTSSTYINTQKKWDYSTYKANISWEATDSIMPYVQYSKGVKTGNVNRSGEFIDPETLDAYEIGIRSRLFSGKLQLNGTAYFYDYNNYNQWYTVYGCKFGQDPNNAGACLNSQGGTDNISQADYTENDYTVLNVGSAKQEGANFNGVWMATQNDSFTINGSWSVNRRKNMDVAGAMRAYGEAHGFYADSADLPSSDTSSRNGERFGGRAFRGNMGYTHTLFIGTDLLVFNATGFYTGPDRDVIMRRDRDDEYEMPGSPDYWTFDVSLGYTSRKWMPEGIQWSLRVYTNNVFDNDELASRSYLDNTTNYTAGSGVISGTYIEPRTFGAIFSVNF